MADKKQPIVLVVDEKTGKAYLTRDIKKGEKITYQNNYMKKRSEIDTITAREDISKTAILNAGAYAKGREIMSAHECSEDYLCIRIVE